MDFFDFREPVSAWTHGCWLALSIPAAALLWKRARGDRGRQISLLIFGLSLTLCFAGSTLYHAVRASALWIDRFNRIDHSSIYVLIAGSYTPVVWNILRGRARWIVLGPVWAIAAAGTLRVTLFGTMPPPVSTTLYLAMGWGGMFCYREIVRQLSHRAGFPLLLGGALYSVGAAFHVMRWPVLWPGVFGAHELFHVFVMGGSLAHFWFMWDVVAPFSHRAGIDRAPHFGRTRMRSESVRG